MESTSRAWRPPQRALAAFVALLIASFLFSESIRSTFFIAFMAFLVAVVLDYPVRFVARVVPRPIAAALVFLLLIASLVTAVRFTVPVLADQGTKVAEQAPESLDRLEDWWNGLRRQASVEGGIAVGFAHSTRAGIYTTFVYFVIQQLEGYLISPLAMRHEIRLAPPILLVWQVAMATAFGIPGVLVATPLLACVKVTVDYFWVERALGKAPQPKPA